MQTRTLAVLIGAAALAVPATAIAHPGKGHDKPAKHHTKKSKDAKKVMFVFKGTFSAPGTVQVLSGNAHARKGGFVGSAVSFDFAGAKVVVADTNGDAQADLADVKDGDKVLVQARLPRRTEYAVAADAIVARKLIDRANPPVDDDGADEPTS